MRRRRQKPMIEDGFMSGQSCWSLWVLKGLRFYWILHGSVGLQWLKRVFLTKSFKDQKNTEACMKLLSALHGCYRI